MTSNPIHPHVLYVTYLGFLQLLTEQVHATYDPPYNAEYPRTRQLHRQFWVDIFTLG